MTSPGPHAFIMVINIAAKHTEEEVASIEHFVRIFGEEVYKYLLVLFTREDELVKNRTELDTFIRGCPQHLQTFVEKCGNRMFAINNERRFSKNKKRVKKLLNHIAQNVEDNGGTCYTNESENQMRDQNREELQNCSDIDSMFQNIMQMSQINMPMTFKQEVWRFILVLLMALAENFPKIVAKLRDMMRCIQG